MSGAGLGVTKQRARSEKRSKGRRAEPGAHSTPKCGAGRGGQTSRGRGASTPMCHMPPTSRQSPVGPTVGPGHPRRAVRLPPVTKLRASDGTLVGTYAVEDFPQHIAFDGTNVWVSNAFSDTVSRL